MMGYPAPASRAFRDWKQVPSGGARCCPDIDVGPELWVTSGKWGCIPPGRKEHPARGPYAPEKSPRVE